TYPDLRGFDPDEMFSASLGIWVSEEEPIDLVLRFDGRWQTYFERTRMHHSQRVQLDEEGAVEVHWKVAWTPEVEQFILRFGSTAEVIAPSTVREAIAKK